MWHTQIFLLDVLSMGPDHKRIDQEHKAGKEIIIIMKKKRFTRFLEYHGETASLVTAVKD